MCQLQTMVLTECVCRLKPKCSRPNRVSSTGFSRALIKCVGLFTYTPEGHLSSRRVVTQSLTTSWSGVPLGIRINWMNWCPLECSAHVRCSTLISWHLRVCGNSFHGHRFQGTERTCSCRWLRPAAAHAPASRPFR